jgi:hypothetical protein
VDLVKTSLHPADEPPASEMFGDIIGAIERIFITIGGIWLTFGSLFTD